MIKVISSSEQSTFVKVINELEEQGWKFMPESFRVNELLSDDFEGTSFYGVMVK